MVTYRSAPLEGPKMPFYVPLPASKRMAALYPDSPDGLFARVLCKDAIGNFLKLPRPGYRTSRFDDADGEAPAPSNEGRAFIINEKVGAKPYIFTLKPGTVIQMASYNYQNPNEEPQDVYKKSISLFFPTHIQVWRVMYWISNKTASYLDDEGTARELANYVPGEELGAISAVTTPSGRKYNIASLLFPNSVEMENPA